MKYTDEGRGTSVLSLSLKMGEETARRSRKRESAIRLRVHKIEFLGFHGHPIRASALDPREKQSRTDTKRARLRRRALEKPRHIERGFSSPRVLLFSLSTKCESTRRTIKHSTP